MTFAYPVEGKAGPLITTRNITTPNISDKRRVLVAESDEANMRMVTSIVESEGFQAVTAHDGREAEQILLSDAAFALSIFEVMLPHVSGLDLLRYMKSEDRLARIPVLMMTRGSTVRLCYESLASGAYALLPAPFTTGQLKSVLCMLVNRPAKARVRSSGAG